MLVDISSKGGNYLLNIGPRGDGSFPPEAVERLHDIGQWMHRFGGGIQGTTASVFENLPWGRSTTRREGSKTRLYLQVFDWPTDGRLVVPGIGNRPLSASIPGFAGMQGVKRDGPDIVVSVPDRAPDSNCTTVELEVEGSPVIYKAPKIMAASNILVRKTSVAMEVPTGLQVRYTLDGREPSDASPAYERPVEIDHGVTLRAASFRNGEKVSATVSQTFEKVEPWPSQGMVEGHPGLWCVEFKGSFDKMPDFSNLQGPRHDFDATGISPAPLENIARRYSGALVVPADEVYTFALTSDDGSRLWLDGKLVVDNDGLHSAETKTGHVPLAKGAHSIVVEWFNKSGGYALDLKWAPVGRALAPLGGASILIDHR